MTLTTGLQVGRWTLVRPPAPGDIRQRWLCHCDCGTERLVRGDSLRSGNHISCGCLRNEAAKRRWTKHGMHARREYQSWLTMMQRCYREANANYAAYGGAGVLVCVKLRDVVAFIDYMGPRPTPGHSLDRKNNAGHYSCGDCEECRTHSWPSNCRWATDIEQQANREITIRLTLGSETLPLTEWARRTGLRTSTIRERLKRGWSIERTLTAPVHTARGWRRGMLGDISRSNAARLLRRESRE